MAKQQVPEIFSMGGRGSAESYALDYTMKAFNKVMEKSINWETEYEKSREKSDRKGKPTVGFFGSVKCYNAYAFYKVAAQIAASGTVPEIPPARALQAANGMFRMGVASVEHRVFGRDLGNDGASPTAEGSLAAAHDQNRILTEDLLKDVQVFRLSTDQLRVASTWYRYFHGPVPRDVGEARLLGMDLIEVVTGKSKDQRVAEAGLDYIRAREAWDRPFMDAVTGRSANPAYVAEHSFDPASFASYLASQPGLNPRAEASRIYDQRIAEAHRYHSALCASLAMGLSSAYQLDRVTWDQALAVAQQYLAETVTRLQKESLDLWPEDTVRRSDIEIEIQHLNGLVSATAPPPPPSPPPPPPPPPPP